MKITKIWIDPEDGATTIFDEQYQELMSKEDFPEAKELYGSFEPHLIIPLDGLTELLTNERTAEDTPDAVGFTEGFNRALSFVKDRLISDE